MDKVKVCQRHDGSIDMFEMSRVDITSEQDWKGYCEVERSEWMAARLNNNNQVINGEFVPNHVEDRPYWLDGKEYVLKHPDTLPEGASFEKPSDISAQEERALRDELLRLSDWAVLPDAPLTAEQKLEWQAYRQALRDIPQQAGFPEFVVVPEAPVME